MVKLVGTFSRLCRRKILVIGDLILDTYIVGKARRISPEAPVAVVQVSHEESRPGGAGNVMLNLVSLGAEVVAVGRVGQDASGEILSQALAAEGIDTRGIVLQNHLCTPVKKRVVAENQQLVRIDYEQYTPISEALEEKIIAMLPSLLQDVSAVAISDYGKGFLSLGLLKALIEKANQQGIPIIADPKGSDFAKYSGSTIIKPNLSEAYAASGLPANADLEMVAEQVLKVVNAETLIVTRSEAGISAFHRNKKRDDFPVKARGVKDVTGAGDTVLAMLTCSIASGLSLNEGIELSNVAAGMAIERFGCARISLSELAGRLLECDTTNKVFDDHHIFALQAALKNVKHVVLGLSANQGMTTSVFAAIRRLGQHSDSNLLIYLTDSNPDVEFVTMLSSLHEIKFILLHSEHIHPLFAALQPESVHIIECQQMIQLDSLSDLLHRKVSL